MRRTALIVAGSFLSVITVPLCAADALAVKTGEWETTVVIETSGMTIPAEKLAQVPPAQRAQMEQMFKQGASGPRSITEKSCITEKDLRERPFQNPAGDGRRDCKHTQVASSGKHQEWTFQCSTPQGPANGRMVVDATSNTQVRGTMEMKMPQMAMNMKFDSKWLGASCSKESKE
jgi:hypothetical protein